MKVKSLHKHIASILSFERLKSKSRIYICDNGYLINSDFVFVVCLPATDYYFLPYFQIFGFENVKTIFSFINSNKIITRLLKIFSNNSLYWNYSKVKYEKHKKYIFFFDGQYILASEKFRLYLKGKYPGCQIIFHLGDLISTKKGIDIKDIKKFADLVVTYDHNDADANGLQYYSDPYSQLPQKMLSSGYPNSNIIFYGLAKNRVEDILGVYDKMKDLGMKCDFSIPDLNDVQCEKRPELANAQFTPYLEYLKRVQNTDCILEIIQKGSRGCTFRTWEAVAYNKKLITNNSSVKEEDFYNPDYIQVIDSIDDVDVEWLKKKLNVDYGFADKLSPKACFEYYVNCLDLINEYNGD